MGWIEDIVEDRRLKSIRAIAVKMSETSSWPAGTQLESVANRLREADKGNAARWWSSKGRALVPALAEVLELDPADVLDRLIVPPALGQRSWLWRFTVFPALGPVDLREGLFPGIPAQVDCPGGPRGKRTWWIAPRGAGKTIVGQRLEMEYGWRVQSVNTWHDIAWPSGRTSLYVELASVENITAKDVQAIPSDVKLCIASPLPPRIAVLAKPMVLDGETTQLALNNVDTSPAHSPFAEFEIVEPPPAWSWTSALITWAAQRVPDGGGFVGPGVERLLRAADVSFDTPGELIAFLGLVDEIGIPQLEAENAEPRRWIREWLKLLLERQEFASAEGTHWLKERGAEILIEMEQRRLRGGLANELLAAQWAALVTPIEAPAVDTQSLLTLLDHADALEQVRSALRAHPSTIVAALQALGILVPASASRLAMRPAWVATVLMRLAHEALVDSGPEAIGALLLSPVADLTIENLRTSILKGSYDAVVACVAVPDSPTPEQVAALNGAFRALGLALLEGANPSTELLQQAWSAQMRFVVRRYGNLPPVPMMSLASDQQWYGMWSLCTLAISRVLLEAHGAAPTELSPWPHLPRDEDERARCIEALERIHAEIGPHVGQPLTHRYRLPAYHLGGALVVANGIVRGDREALALQWPDLLVDLALGNASELTSEERMSFCELRFGVDVLEAVCERRGVELARVLSSCWEQWGHAPDGSPPIAWLHPEREDLLPTVRRLWDAAPDVLPEALYEALRRFAGRALPFTPWQLLRPSHWRDWLRHRRKRDMYSYEDAWRFIPEEIAVAALREGDGPATPTSWRLLWQRFGEALLGLVDYLALHETSSSSLLALVGAAPAERIHELIHRARQWIAAPERFPAPQAWISRWLLHVLETRPPGWREAYELWPLVAARS